MNKQNNNQSPFIRPLNQSQLKEAILKSLIEEASSAEFYSRLMSEAIDDTHKELIERSRDIKLKHLQSIENLYVYYFLQKPQYQINRIEYENYKDALFTALKNQLESSERYRDIQLSTREQPVRETFYKAMIDELTLATRFGVLYNMA